MNTSVSLYKLSCFLKSGQTPLLVVLMAGSVLGAPYPPEGLESFWTGKDGKQLSLRVFGDEFYGRTETSSGHTVIFDAADGEYFYAKEDPATGKLVTTGVRAGLPPPAGLTPHLRESPQIIAEKHAARVAAMVPDQEEKWRRRVEARRNQRAPDAGLPPSSQNSEAYEDPTSAPFTGGRVGLVVLVQFPNDPNTLASDPVNFPVSRDKIERYCNQVGYVDDGNTGSIRDYFFQQSLGKLTFTQSVSQIVTLPHPRNHYNYADYPTNTALSHPPSAGGMMVSDAIAILKAGGYDFSSLTVDTENKVVSVSIFFAGGNSGVWARGLWPHSSQVGLQINIGTDAKPIYISNFQCTNIPTAQPSIGTNCHELGHLLLGYPDLYDRGLDSEGVGAHCLMGSGNYLNGGRTPAPINLYFKHLSGWAEIIDLQPAQPAILELHSTGNVGFRIVNPETPSEFFLAENRGEGDPWAAACPDKGIAIWHIDENQWNNNSEEMTPAAHYFVSVQQADGEFDLENGRNRGDSEDFYDFTTVAFTDDTVPDARWWAGESSRVVLDVLSPPGPTMQISFSNAPWNGNIVQNLPDGTESVWMTSGGNTLADSSLSDTGGLLNDAFNSAGTLSIQTRPDYGDLAATNAWNNRAITPQTGQFTASFVTVPSGGAVDTVLGFSNGLTDFWNNLAAYVRFNTDGRVDARNAANFASVNVLNYVAGTSYLVEMTINVGTKRYWVTVTPNGGSPVIIASNYAFRTEQNSVSQLTHFVCQMQTAGSQAVSNLITPATEVTLPALVSPNSNGPMTSVVDSGGLSVSKVIELINGAHATIETTTFTNTGSVARNVAFSIADNYGSDAGTVVHLTSSGDSVVDPGDRWFILSDRSNPTERGDDPALRVSWEFPVSVPAPVSIQIPGNGNDMLSFAFGWTLPAGASAEFVMRRELFATASAAITSVTTVTTLEDSGPGSLREVVASAPVGGVVRFDPLLDGQTSFLSDPPIPIDKNLSIDASTLPAGLILSGSELSGILEIGGDVDITLTGLSFTGVNNEFGNGAIVNAGHLVVEHCTFYGNRTGSVGGGILNTGFLEVSRCTFSDNFAYSGGAIESWGDVRITHSTFTDNGAESGGAIAIDESMLAISNSTFAYNGANFSGGAVKHEGILDMANCTVIGNFAAYGGGIHNDGGFLELSGSIIADNDADEGEPSDIEGPINNEGTPNLLGSIGGTSGHTGLIGDPLLQPLGIYGGPTLTMPPQTGSPAIDAGGQAIGTDQRGLPRQVGAAADIGAVESGNDHPSITVTTVIDEDDGNLGGAVSIREAMRYGDPGSLIHFAPGLNAASITLIKGELIAARNQIVDASTLAAGITISGADTTRVFKVRLATRALLKSLVIEDGNDDYGGGILNQGTLTLLDCVIAKCRAEVGGGIASFGSLELEGCRVEGNFADTFSGGGIEFSGDKLSISNSKIYGNSNIDWGGAGLRVSSGYAELENSTISDNYSVDGSGGGISNAGRIKLTSCTITANDSATGGGIKNYGHLSLDSCTISNNVCSSQDFYEGYEDFGGGGINNHDESTLHLLNTIVAGNTDLAGTAPDIRGVVEPQDGQNLISNPRGCVGFTGLIGDPLLGPLADNGGPTQTMLPQVGSPVIDAAATTSLTVDQRGQPRVSGLSADLGSVELQFLIVTTLEDSGAGSLRQAISTALSNSIIVFHPSLDGRTIWLSSGPLAITTPVRIDGRLLSNGITISGAGESRVIEVAAGSHVVLASLNITDGKSELSGAGIYNHGNLTLEGSTVCHNFSFLDGGGIYNTGQLALVNSTIAANLAGDAGGGIYNDLGAISAIHSTISDNTAFFAAGGGIGNDGSVRLENSIVAGNHAVTYPAVFNLHDFSGHDPTETGSNFRAGNPRLGPLGNYDSGVRTMPPLPGSPVMETATLLASTPATDQLGNPRPSGPLPDLGAVEAFAFAPLNLADTDDDDFPDILESSFGLVVGIDDSGTDSDGDGSSDADELRNMTDPFDPADSFRITGFTRASGFDPETLPAFTVSFPTFPGLKYSIEADQNLDYQGADLEIIHGPFTATGFHQQVDVVLRTARDFIRVKRE